MYTGIEFNKKGHNKVAKEVLKLDPDDRPTNLFTRAKMETDLEKKKECWEKGAKAPIEYISLSKEFCASSVQSDPEAELKKITRKLLEGKSMEDKEFNTLKSSYFPARTRWINAQVAIIKAQDPGLSVYYAQDQAAKDFHGVQWLTKSIEDVWNERLGLDNNDLEKLSTNLNSLKLPEEE